MSTSQQSQSQSTTNGPRKANAIEKEIKALTDLRNDPGTELTRAQKTAMTKKLKDLQHELTEAQGREGITPTEPAQTAATATATVVAAKVKKPKTYTVQGFNATPVSASGSRFDNEAIARASETAEDLWALETALNASHGYSLDDGGAFRRRLANMVRNGQIDAKFTPTGQKRPTPEQIAERVAAQQAAEKEAKASKRRSRSRKAAGSGEEQKAA